MFTMPSPPLSIRLKRHSDASASITLTRANGTVTWQRQQGSLALVFPQHDLTHYAVEQTLGFHGAFFGLVADGWDISDFAVPFPKGPVPLEAREVEMLVGLFDGMRAVHQVWNAAELNAEMRVLANDSKFAGVQPRPLSDDDVARVRAVRNELIAKWKTTPRDESIELKFVRAQPFA